MRKDIADKWIAALRDPNAKQGIGVLERHDGSQCCLGVLCRVLGMVPEESGDGYLAFDGNSGSLPRRAMELSGVSTPEGQVPDLDTLSHINDTVATFPEIADIIEQHWEVL